MTSLSHPKPCQVLVHLIKDWNINIGFTGTIQFWSLVLATAPVGTAVLDILPYFDSVTGKNSIRNKEKSGRRSRKDEANTSLCKEILHGNLLPHVSEYPVSQAILKPWQILKALQCQCLSFPTLIPGTEAAVSLINLNKILTASNGSWRSVRAFWKICSHQTVRSIFYSGKKLSRASSSKIPGTRTDKSLFQLYKWLLNLF